MYTKWSALAEVCAVWVTSSFTVSYFHTRRRSLSGLCLCVSVTQPKVDGNNVNCGSCLPTLCLYVCSFAYNVRCVVFCDQIHQQCSHTLASFVFILHRVSAKSKPIFARNLRIFRKFPSDLAGSCSS